jgi:hypothetical protein
MDGAIDNRSFFRVANCVQQEQAIVIKQLVHDLHETAVIFVTNVFDHAADQDLVKS